MSKLQFELIFIERFTQISSKYVIRKNETDFGEVFYGQFPGCCGIALFTGLKIKQEYRGRGIGKELIKLLITKAKSDNYSTLVCTDVQHNIPMIMILEEYGFKHVYTFNNNRTDNNVNISVKDLNCSGFTDSRITTDVGEVKQFMEMVKRSNIINRTWLQRTICKIFKIK